MRSTINGIANRYSNHPSSNNTKVNPLANQNPSGFETVPIVARSRVVTSNGVTGLSCTMVPNTPPFGGGNTTGVSNSQGEMIKRRRRN